MPDEEGARSRNAVVTASGSPTLRRSVRIGIGLRADPRHSLPGRLHQRSFSQSALAEARCVQRRRLQAMPDRSAVSAGIGALSDLQARLIRMGSGLVPGKKDGQFRDLARQTAIRGPGHGGRFAGMCRYLRRHVAGSCCPVP